MISLSFSFLLFKFFFDFLQFLLALFFLLFFETEEVLHLGGYTGAREDEDCFEPSFGDSGSELEGVEDVLGGEEGDAVDEDDVEEGIRIIFGG